MSEFFEEIRSHYSSNGPLGSSGPFGDKGNDVFDLSIPSGEQLATCTLEVLEENRGTARFAEEPQHGATGSVRANVRWSYEGFGKIRFKIKATSESAVSPPVRATILSDAQSHWTAGPMGDRGTDVVAVHLEECIALETVELQILQQTAGGARIVSQPAVGSAGDLQFEVRWWHNGHGRIRYRLRVHTVARQEICIRIGPLTFDPNPGRAGGQVTLSADLTNMGTRTFERFRVLIDATALSLDDVAQNILDRFSFEERTRSLDPFPATLLLEPGQTRRLEGTMSLPSELPRLGWSSAGRYRLLIRLEDDGGTQLGSRIVEEFRIVVA